MLPTIIKGGSHKDSRGKLLFNNDFDTTVIKRIYFIENETPSILRQWQGHKIEQRWFSAILGEFKIQLIKIDNWESPNKNLNTSEFKIKADTFDVLHIPKGYVTSIQSLTENARLIVFSDYLLNEIKDEYKFPIDYFKK